MSLYDYRQSREICKNEYPFYAVLMAAMRQADDVNLKLLKEAFPWVWQELSKRYNAPNGLIGEEVNDGQGD